MTIPDPLPVDLESLLTAEPYIEDEGFTDQVLARLPATARPKGWILLAVATLAAGGMLMVSGGGASLLGLVLAPLASGASVAETGSILSLSLALMAVGALAWLPLTLALDED